MRYTKAELEELVHCQLANLNAIHDLLRILKEQNELLHCVNKKMEAQLSEQVIKPYPRGKPKSTV